MSLSAPTRLQRGLELARRGQLEVFVTRDLARFARALTKQLMKEYEFLRNGVAVEYVLEQYDDSLQGQLLKNLRAVIAEYNRGEISERLERARHRSVRRGNVMLAANPPFGYRVVTTDGRAGKPRRTLEIVEDEARTIRQIFEWYVYGDESGPLSGRKIAERLTEAGVPTKWDKRYGGERRISRKRGHWSGSSVGYIIRSKTYAGEWIYKTRFGDITVAVPAIISKTLFDAAQRKRASASTISRRNTRYDYLLRGRVLCASCGYKMHAHTRVARNREYSYYSCGGASKVPERRYHCDYSSYRMDQVDPAVWSEIKRLITSPALMRQRLEASHDTESMQRISREINAIQAQIDQAEKKKERLADLYLDGEFDKDHLNQRAHRINSDIRRLSQERDSLLTRLRDTEARIENAQSLEQYAEMIQSKLAVADRDFSIRRAIIDVLEVVVRLETSELKRWAHLEIEGQHISSIPLPDVKPRRKRSKNHS